MYTATGSPVTSAAPTVTSPGTEDFAPSSSVARRSNDYMRGSVPGTLVQRPAAIARSKSEITPSGSLCDFRRTSMWVVPARERA